MRTKETDWRNISCQAIARALGDNAAPGVDPANYTVIDEELLKRVYGL